jgi:ethanolamine utilization protein EutQ (cupin superfamily)
VAIALEGEVETTLEDGRVLRVGPGYVIDTPKGSSDYRKDLTVSRGYGRW